MLKGHTKIILKDVATGREEVHEDNNLVTNAIDKIINCEIAMNHYPNDCLLPIATKLLGGIMLFDGELTEDVNNIHFPVEAHLVGYGDQSANTSDKFRGSYNASESGKTESGFVSVWDFGTSQANGTIKAVARTHNHAGANPLFYYCCPSLASTHSGSPEADTYWYPIRYDGEYIYMLKGDSSAHLMRLARARIPMLRMGVADFSNVARTYEIIASWSTEVFSYTYYSNDRYYQYDVTVYADDPIMYEDGQDGYIYCMFNGVSSGLDTDYPYDLNYFTIKYSDESYDKSDTVHKNLGLSGYLRDDHGRCPGRVYGHINHGIYYFLGGTRKIIHEVPLNNPAAFRSVRIIADESSDYICSLDYVSPHNGGVYFQVHHYTASSYNYLNGFLYPDGVYVLPDKSYGGSFSDHGNSSYYMRVRTMDDDLTAWGYDSSTTILRGWAANYLGTINNLAAPITKTAAQTMKIVYTLTNVEDEE